eukprot:4846317-Alexandrium_andersonii.AAC.1
MSASLVGSEMCIRDSVKVIPVLNAPDIPFGMVETTGMGAAVRQAKPLQGSRVECPPARRRRAHPVETPV